MRANPRELHKVLDADPLGALHESGLALHESLIDGREQRHRSTPANAASSVAGSSKLALTSSAPAWWRSAARVESWTVARTRMPAASNARTTRRPLVPVAPVTRIMERSSLFRCSTLHPAPACWN